MLGIVPAAGKSKRFDGRMKEFLPIADNRFTLDNAFHVLHRFGAYRYIVISNPEKIGRHADHIQLHTPEYVENTQFMLQQDYSDMWGALRLTLPYSHSYNMMVMPDTYWTSTVEPASLYGSITFGVFATRTPERFSIIDTGKIITKQSLPAGVYFAWGTVIWTDAVADFWMRQEEVKPYRTYDDAFQDAINHFGYQTFGIDQYYDFASWDKYQAFMNRA